MTEKRQDHPEKLKEMACTDIKTVNEKELVDISNVQIHTELPQKERILDYLNQVKNPYCYISHGTIVKISFSGTRKLKECLNACIEMES